jgi:hypothetical protein
LAALVKPHTCPVQVAAVRHAVVGAGHCAGALHATQLPLPSQNLPLEEVHAVSAATLAVPHTPALQVRLTQSLLGAGQSVGPPQPVSAASAGASGAASLAESGAASLAESIAPSDASTATLASPPILVLSKSTISEQPTPDAPAAARRKSTGATTRDERETFKEDLVARG